ncbi:MAG: MFS transporter [Hyphomicrobiaceae bacterium]
MQKLVTPLRTPAQRATLYAIAGIGVTQVIGWGTSFNTLTVFATTIAQDLGLSRVVVFSGITLQLLVAALLAPRVGRFVDRMGARPVMLAGAFVAALAMLAQGQASGLISYMLGWVLIGISAPMLLSNAAMPGLVQVVGANARRAITGLTLISGLTSTFFLPINYYLLSTVGWRWAYVVFAGMHVFICAPIIWLVVRRGAGIGDAVEEAAKPKPPTDGILAPPLRRRAFVLLAIWACTEGILTWGLYMQVIDIFVASGIPTTTAVAVWGIVGLSQSGARIAELVTGAKHSILTTSIASAALTSTSFLAFLAFGINTTSAILFCLAMGLGHGLFAVARNTLPLMLFGPREYGQYMGLLMVPQNIVNAAAPIVMAAIITYWSPTGALWMSALAAGLGCISVYMLASYCRGYMGGR